MAAGDELALHQQIDELLTHPREDMGCDCKAWIDFGEKPERAKIAKDLMAFANHGGGFIVFGIDEADDKQLIHGGPAQYVLKHYSQDALNDIVKAYASPAFECRVLRRSCPVGCGAEHVVVKVPGEHRVPIRCRRGAPDPLREPKKGEVYIRRPKPESAPIEEPHEWDDLFERCIRARQDDLIEAFMKVVGAVGTGTLSEVFGASGDPSEGGGPAGPRALVEDFRRSSNDRFLQLQAEHELEDRYAHGVWTVSYAVIPAAVGIQLPRLMTLLVEAAGSETGWPPWWVPTREGIEPYPHDEMIECWLAEPGATSPEDPLSAALYRKDAAHSDFWRASPNGRLFLARGYQEDGLQGREPGTILDFTTIPIWRLAECLLHAQRFALEAGGPDASVAFLIRWEGLAGRTLVSLTDRDVDSRLCRQDAVESYGLYAAASIRGRLAEIVQELASPLYAAFEFFDPAPRLYEDELKRMLER
jgi:transcriptional regulator with XRE-family HTH domain